MRRIKLVLLCLIFMTLLSLVFNGYVVVFYDYWFQSYSVSNWIAYIPAVTAVFLLLYFNEHLKKPSDFLCWTYYLLVTVPTTVITPQMGLSIDVVLKAGAIVVLANTAILFASKVNVVYGKRDIRFVKKKWVSVLFMLLGGGVIALILGSYRLNINELLDLSIFVDTYEIRADFRDAGASGLAVYAVFWAAKVIFPGIIAYGLCYEKKVYVWIGVAFQILLFTVSAHKSFVFSAMLLFIVYFLLKRNVSLRGWLGYASVFMGFSLGMFYIFSTALFVDVFVRRAFVVPGILAGWWAEYFTNNPYALFAGGLLGGLFSPDDLTPAAFRIGDYYLRSIWTSANVNFAMDAFGNGGVIYFLIACAIVFVLLTIVNGAARLGERERIFFTCVSVPLYWTLIETSLIATMVTHGFFLLLILAITWKASAGNSLAQARSQEGERVRVA